MANPFSNKKKIRGWKRKIKQIEQWKQRHIDLDLEQLSFNNRNYVKIWIDPFYRLTRRNPPMWFSRLILEAMIEIYQSWFLQIKRLNEPFYLKIWLYNPNFIQSQIVIAFREYINYYDNTFDTSNEVKAFPSEWYGSIAGLEQFKWLLAIDSNKYWLSELKEDIPLGFKTAKGVEVIKNKAYKCDTLTLNYGEDTVYSVKVGDVWIGEII
ncbi:hypothetical protein [Paenibacillus typhae]|uniref:Uncharacterized protein n=1 Tax=Paenibacillus typhae TaxID=1174501 RepID=A0A1G8ZVE7_9BACL|nr:hypothetical protein [Paenibacillus typhae]SDK18335.1 hypothetical protein SAMN05216192_1349 [Paenibacillus typhae]